MPTRIPTVGPVVGMHDHGYDNVAAQEIRRRWDIATDDQRRWLVDFLSYSTARGYMRSGMDRVVVNRQHTPGLDFILVDITRAAARRALGVDDVIMAKYSPSPTIVARLALIGYIRPEGPYDSDYVATPESG